MQTFKNNILAIYAQEGQRWLDLLPSQVQIIKNQYHLSNLQPVKNLSYNYILKGFQADKKIILKIAIDKEALEKEANALEAFQGVGVPKLYVREKNFLILEQVLPGSTLKDYFPSKEFNSIEIFCTVLKNLHRINLPKKHGFQSIEKWLVALDHDYDIPMMYLAKARALYRELLRTQPTQILLHGDLHHENILKHHNQWIAIDPKGVIGDPAFDVCAFIRNPIPDLLGLNNPKDIINQRINSCAKLLNLSKMRIYDWFFVEAVLSWLWNLEDNLDPSYFKHLLEMIN
ncbi:phosphotransferase [Thiotrichales bacterium 19S3-7]|nr:phosphotransferase [Thiotrichales bacterium 19S3-7]MCF6801188.1 phosphotransferase [Thiotrichales bacterium 19S3-11]